MSAPYSYFTERALFRLAIIYADEQSYDTPYADNGRVAARHELVSSHEDFAFDAFDGAFGAAAP